MKKILFVNSISTNILGGGEKWYINIANALKKDGYTVHLISRPSSKISHEFHKFTSNIYELKFGFDFYPISIYKIYRYIKRHEIDALVGSFTKDISIAGVAAKLARLNIILFRNGFPVLHKKWKHKLLLPYFTKIITNSSKIKKIYDTYAWDLENRIKVIHNGIVEPESIKTVVIDKKRDIILGAGRLTQMKRFSIFLDVCSEIEKTRAIQIFLAGEGEEKEILEKKAHDLNLQICFLGQVDSILPYLQHADLFLHCSANEGMPNVVMEAMYMGTPVVASNAGATDELISHESDGFVCEIDNKSEFTMFALKILKSKIIQKRFSVNAKKKIEEQFLFKKSLEKFKNELL